jgi:signal peptidase I
MNFTRVLADLLASGKTVRFTAPGHSMHPVIRHGDVLLVTPPDRPVQVGDILLYRDAAGRPVAHRLVGFAAGGEEDTLILRGDSAAGPDLPVRTGQVLGRVVAVERRGRRFDPHGALTVVGCGLIAAAIRFKSGLLQCWNRKGCEGRSASS